MTSPITSQTTWVVLVTLLMCACGPDQKANALTTVFDEEAPDAMGTVQVAHVDVWPGAPNLVEQALSGVGYSTYLGFSATDRAYAVAADKSGNAYVLGYTEASELQVCPCLFVAKMAWYGELLYFFYFPSPAAPHSSIAVDDWGSAYFAWTLDGDSPTSWVAKLKADGTDFVYFTGPLPFHRRLFDIAVNSGGDAFVVGDQRTQRGDNDVYVGMLAPQGGLFQINVVFGGTKNDSGSSIARDSNGNMFVTGSTFSTDFPVTSAFQPTLLGEEAAFVTKLNASGTSKLYSTYLGGTNSTGQTGGSGIDVDAAGRAYVVGWTDSVRLPTTPGVFQPGFRGFPYDGWLGVLNPTGDSLRYLTYFGGSDDDVAQDVVVDRVAGTAYVAGWTLSNDLLGTGNGFQPSPPGSGDTFVFQASLGGQLLYASYLGGSRNEVSLEGRRIALDPADSLYVAGRTTSPDFPTNVYGYGGGEDGFVTKFCQPGGCSRPPRPLSPLSTAKVTSQLPTLRWRLPAGVDGARVQICRDRACTTVEQLVDFSGSSGRLTTPLAPGVHYWRLFARAGDFTDATPGPTWELFAGARSTAVDTSWGTVADFNGDGYADLAVGAYSAAAGGAPQVGRVYVYYGSASGLPATPGRILDGPDGASGLFGLAVTSAGDVNGDGYADLAVGAPDASVVGKVHVYFGGAGGLAATPSETLAGQDGANAAFGLGLAAIGDANGDGYADLAVSAPYANASSLQEAGRVRVYFGGPTGLATTAGQTFDGPDGAQADFGSDVEGIGDVNGDGYADLAVGADYATVGGFSGSGRVHVYLGGSAGLVTPPSLTLDSPDVAGRFGSVIGSGGDLNGDGYADLMIGSYQAQASAGRVRIYWGGQAGISATPGPVLDGPDGANGFFGYAIGCAGDLDGDGYADLVVGAARATVGGATAAGRAYLYPGGLSGVTTAPSRTFDGPDGDLAYFGAAIADGGDFNKDGRSDLVIGAYSAMVGGVAGTGRVHVYSGGALPSQDLANPAGAGGSFGVTLTR